jgi:predicted Zn-dependent protease
MRKIIFLTLLIAQVFTSCHRNSIIGRNQLSLVSESEMQTLALTQYKQFLSSNNVMPDNNKDAIMEKRVGNKIAAAISKYYSANGKANELQDYHWEFNLVDSKEVNAWCMPGGKVVVYTGLLPFTQNEAALAIVLGHEITHAIAGHGKERMSQQLLAQGIGVLGGVALSSDSRSVDIFNQIYAPTAQVGVLLPNSRKQESEADHYGLIFAAMAGYNPQEAISFWKRMAAAGGAKSPVFLSDHPSDETRIKSIEKLMPEVLTYYHPTDKNGR